MFSPLARSLRRCCSSLAVLLPVFVAAASVACSDDASANDTYGGEGGGTRPPDGAPGVCCPPSTGGCAYIGGYRESGDCRVGKVCDNMCEQRIVDDVHGCKKMVYKTPPVLTTAAGPGSCDDPVFNGGHAGTAGDAGEGDAGAADAAAE